MLFVIFNILSREIYFKSYFESHYIEDNISKIIKMFNNRVYLKNEEKYQLAFKIRESVAFGGIRAYNGGSYNGRDIIPCKQINLQEILNFIHELSEIITEEEINLLTTNQFKLTKEIILQRLNIKNIHNKSKILIVGGGGAGVSSIMFMNYGLTLTNNLGTIIYHVTTNINVKNEKLMFFFTPYRSDLYHHQISLFPAFSSIIYVEDSTRKEVFNEYNYILKKIKEEKKRKKEKRFLIIANKQDLPGAMEPEKIEEITGITTVGFSAIDPDAPKHLEKIISDFLKK
ncbi:MAG: ADP-ribosylation factor-like protein [Promethearchaeota archaeon]